MGNRGVLLPVEVNIINQYVTGVVIRQLRKNNKLHKQIEHEMTKTQYISFITSLFSDGLQLIKLYPKGNPETRLKLRGVKKYFVTAIKMVCFTLM